MPRVLEDGADLRGMLASGETGSSEAYHDEAKAILLVYFLAPAVRPPHTRRISSKENKGHGGDSASGHICPKDTDQRLTGMFFELSAITLLQPP